MLLTFWPNPIAFQLFWSYQTVMKPVFIIALLTAFISNAAEPANSPAKTNAAPPVDLGAMFRMHWDNQVRLFKEQNQVVAECRVARRQHHGRF